MDRNGWMRCINISELGNKPLLPVFQTGQLPSASPSTSTSSPPSASTSPTSPPPPNRLSPPSAPRSGQSRCGQTRNSVAGKRGGEPSVRERRGGEEGDARRTHLDRGADTPLLGFNFAPVLPLSYEHFGTSLFPVSPYPEIRPNPPSKTQALMHNRPGLFRETPRNRVRGRREADGGRTRGGDNPNSVAGVEGRGCGGRGRLV